MISKLHGIYGYRFFIASSIRNEFKSKFSRSKLGALWLIINPLVQSVVYATVLSSIISARLPEVQSKYGYALYLLSGMLAWALFQEVTMGCVNVFVDKADLMKKVAFPRACLPMISSGVALINNALLFSAIVLVFIVLGHGFDWAMISFPLVVAINFLLAMSLGTILGIINVLIRDVSQVVLIVFQALFWLTPIVYTSDILPPAIKGFLKWSPVYQLVEMYHGILVYGKAPSLQLMAALAGLAVFLAFLAIFVYRRAASDMADAL